MLASPVPMHIPDGFLSVLVSVTLWIVSVLVIAYALKRVNADLDERRIPLMGVLAAAIFAAQMLNFTVVGGTSGHLMGAALATILLGPWAAILVMTSVVGIQALIFQDGGLLVLGANIFNMGIVGVAVSYAAYQLTRTLLRDTRRTVLIGGFVAAWLSIFITSLSVALQLALSGISPANIAIPAMGGIHALIGIGEGLITVSALGFILAARPDLVRNGMARPVGGKVVLGVGLGAALLLAVLSPLASAHPDGLERVAEQQGFLSAARTPAFTMIPDYVFPGVSNQNAATILAGIVGTVLVFAVALGIAYTRRRKPTPTTEK